MDILARDAASCKRPLLSALCLYVCLQHGLCQTHNVRTTYAAKPVSLRATSPTGLYLIFQPIYLFQQEKNSKRHDDYTMSGEK